MENLPLEDLCEIVRSIDGRDLGRLLQTSKYLRDVAHACVEWIELVSGTIVPAESLIAFQRLRGVVPKDYQGGLIRDIKIELEDLDQLLATGLSRLSFGHFLFPSAARTNRARIIGLLSRFFEQWSPLRHGPTYASCQYPRDRFALSFNLVATMGLAITPDSIYLGSGVDFSEQLLGELFRRILPTIGSRPILSLDLFETGTTSIARAFLETGRQAQVIEWATMIPIETTLPLVEVTQPEELRVIVHDPLEQTPAKSGQNLIEVYNDHFDRQHDRYGWELPLIVSSVPVWNGRTYPSVRRFYGMIDPDQLDDLLLFFPKLELVFLYGGLPSNRNLDRGSKLQTIVLFPDLAEDPFAILA